MYVQLFNPLILVLCHTFQWSIITTIIIIIIIIISIIIISIIIITMFKYHSLCACLLYWIWKSTKGSTASSLSLAD